MKKKFFFFGLVASFFLSPFCSPSSAHAGDQIVGRRTKSLFVPTRKSIWADNWAPMDRKEKSLPPEGGNNGDGYIRPDQWRNYRMSYDGNSVPIQEQVPRDSIVFKKNYVPDVSSVEVKPAASQDHNANYFDLILTFEKSIIPLGQYKTEKDIPKKVALAPDVLLNLQNRFDHTVGTLELRDDTGKVLAENQVLLSIGDDYYCQHPIILSDFHGTLDRADSCTNDSIKSLIAVENTNFLVVSSTGSSVEGDIKKLPFYKKDHFLVLDNAVFTGGGGYSDNEKALRVFQNLAFSGACIVGFVGDTPDKEGAASLSLNIPFISVNQTDRVTYRQMDVEEPTCAYINQQEFDTAKELCPANYKNTFRNEVLCSIESQSPSPEIKRPKNDNSSFGLDQRLRSGNGGSADYRETTKWVKIPDSTTDLLKKPGTTPNPCDVGYKATQMKSQHFCILEIPYEVAPFPDKKCPDDYLKAKKKYKKSIVDNRYSSFRVEDYPENSSYNHDWCEAKTAALKLLTQQRP